MHSGRLYSQSHVFIVGLRGVMARGGADGVITTTHHERKSSDGLGSTVISIKRKRIQEFVSLVSVFVFGIAWRRRGCYAICNMKPSNGAR